MIRSTPIGFEASKENMDDMIDSIEQFKTLPIDGFVIGLLKNECCRS
jgi:copper homeostasis protein CutC